MSFTISSPLLTDILAGSRLILDIFARLVALSPSSVTAFSVLTLSLEEKGFWLNL